MEKEIIMTTTDIIPGYEYEIIDIVIGNRIMSFFTKTESRKALEKLKIEAINLGANAIVGIKPDSTKSGSQCYIGTAVKLIKK